jgi:hypothetical protein
MRTTIDETPDGVGMILWHTWRRPDRLLTSSAPVRATNYSPAMTLRRLDDGPPLRRRIPQGSIDFLFGWRGTSSGLSAAHACNRSDRIFSLARRAARCKTWREKLADKKDLPKVVKISGPMSRRWGEGTVAIAAPFEVDQLMKRVRRGKLITINELRAAIAENGHGWQ